MVRSYSYGPNTLPSWDSFRSSPTTSHHNTSLQPATTSHRNTSLQPDTSSSSNIDPSDDLPEQNGNFLQGEEEEEHMEIEVSPATPRREWSPLGPDEDPSTMGIV